MNQENCLAHKKLKMAHSCLLIAAYHIMHAMQRV
jgi:hypothetical protein